MSLLIKALESAEKGKHAERKRGLAEDASSVTLALDPLSIAETTVTDKQIINSAAEAPSNQTDSFAAAAAASVPKVNQYSESSKDSKQQVAANVFVANQAAKNSTSASVLLLLGAAGALLIWGGLQGYLYITQVKTPEIAVVNPSAAEAVTAELKSATETPAQTNTVDAQSAAVMPASSDAQAAKTDVNTYAGISTETALIPETNSAISRSVVSNKALANKPAQSRNAVSDNTANDNANALNISDGENKKSTPLKLVSRTPAAVVDPILLAAYEAYSRGDDAAAQKQYRQVLQGDTRNVDALLGMAAIALRQSRHADANGWYQKVLEVEPRNSTALSALANLQINNESAGAAAADDAGTESRIKSMLAQQPDAANLHAALGNLYAAQNQWPQAQAAYFNASRYAPTSADYAFNLAVSLDQLGKSALALAQYQRALGLLNNSSASNLNKAELEARIQALQQ
jgi:Tfp pilus assembly protein PilF